MAASSPSASSSLLLRSSPEPARASPPAPEGALAIPSPARQPGEDQRHRSGLGQQAQTMQRISPAPHPTSRCAPRCSSAHSSHRLPRISGAPRRSRRASPGPGADPTYCLCTPLLPPGTRPSQSTPSEERSCRRTGLPRPRSLPSASSRGSVWPASLFRPSSMARARSRVVPGTRPSCISRTRSPAEVQSGVPHVCSLPSSSFRASFSCTMASSWLSKCNRRRAPSARTW
mmetsp:Transcript_35993/g.103519  ORF Transcript_35993/g.103519 Transcript_35993/m.103519 type:complete len:230 (+) Transcript_35993:217-906(+)